MLFIELAKAIALTIVQWLESFASSSLHHPLASSTILPHFWGIKLAQE